MPTDGAEVPSEKTEKEKEKPKIKRALSAKDPTKSGAPAKAKPKAKKSASKAKGKEDGQDAPLLDSTSQHESELLEAEADADDADEPCRSVRLSGIEAEATPPKRSLIESQMFNMVETTENNAVDAAAAEAPEPREAPVRGTFRMNPEMHSLLEASQEIPKRPPTFIEATGGGAQPLFPSTSSDPECKRGSNDSLVTQSDVKASQALEEEDGEAGLRRDLEMIALQEARDLHLSCFQPSGYELVGADLESGYPPYVTCHLTRLGDSAGSAKLYAEEQDSRRKAVLRCLQTVDEYCSLAAEAGFLVVGCDIALRQLPTVSIKLDPGGSSSAVEGNGHDSVEIRKSKSTKSVMGDAKNRMGAAKKSALNMFSNK